MTIWDDIGGLFTGDTYFPDNPSREHRAQELAQDCQDLAGKLSLLAPQIKAGLQALDDRIASLYERSVDVPPDVRPTQVQFNQWSVSASQLVIPVLTGTVASSALTIAATSYLASTGEIGAAAFAELVGLPAVFEIGIGAAAGIAAIGISFAIGAISGAVRRDKLQEAIHAGVRGRLSAQKAYLVNYRLLTSISAMAAAVAALQAAHVDKAEVISNLQKLVKQASAQIEAVTDDDAANVLATLDRSRGSWTNEDY